MLAGGAAMAGHWRPLFLGFARGGKTVATCGGAPSARAARRALLRRDLARDLPDAALLVGRVDARRGCSPPVCIALGGRRRWSPSARRRRRRRRCFTRRTCAASSAAPRTASTFAAYRAGSSDEASFVLLAAALGRGAPRRCRAGRRRGRRPGAAPATTAADRSRGGHRAARAARLRVPVRRRRRLRGARRRRCQTDAETFDAWWRGQDPTRTPRFDLFAFPCCRSSTSACCGCRSRRRAAAGQRPLHRHLPRAAAPRELEEGRRLLRRADRRHVALRHGRRLGDDRARLVSPSSTSSRPA